MKYEYRRGASATPIFHGAVVRKEHQTLVLDAAKSIQLAREKQQKIEREKDALRAWRQLLIVLAEKQDIERNAKQWEQLGQVAGSNYPNSRTQSKSSQTSEFDDWDSIFEQ